ncbi:unnamed protein product [Pseudo-nitzschia multistriata]|uniref:Uncharacterized protein n=1 Tax=Pseudo-nitzschia multistriata TaxID=183589 RepID=A0A448ZRH5_9STRA|nr:unnamed protein product [Pseudo-nitzschia multistriata]
MSLRRKTTEVRGTFRAPNLSVSKTHLSSLLVLAAFMLFLDFDFSTNFVPETGHQTNSTGNATDGVLQITRGQQHHHAYRTTNSTTAYRWIGENWIPPPGVPYFRGSDLRRLFRAENTLWLGDSTARQDYQTMNSILSAPDPDNVGNFAVMRNINKYKYSKNETFHCPARQPPVGTGCKFPCTGGLEFQDMGQVPGTDAGCDPNPPEIASGTTGNSSGVSRYGIGKFDFSAHVCFQGIPWMLRQDDIVHTIESNYSVLIISMGIWEVTRAWDCRIEGLTSSSVLTEALDALERLSGPELFVVWKTHGPVAGEKDLGAETVKLQSVARRWFESNRPEHMDLSDFGGVVLDGNRSFGEERLVGDLKPHWGATARTLSIQMASNSVHLKQQRNGIGGEGWNEQGRG